MLVEGNKVLLAHRRLFERDEPRYFVGEVLAFEAGLVKVAGYSFVRDLTSGKVIRKHDKRVKIVSLNSGTALAYQLPDALDVESVMFQCLEGDVLLADGKSVRMDMAELPHGGRI